MIPFLGDEEGLIVEAIEAQSSELSEECKIPFLKQRLAKRGTAVNGNLDWVDTSLVAATCEVEFEGVVNSTVAKVYLVKFGGGGEEVFEKLEGQREPEEPSVKTVEAHELVGEKCNFQLDRACLYGKGAV